MTAAGRRPVPVPLYPAANTEYTVGRLSPQSRERFVTQLNPTNQPRRMKKPHQQGLVGLYISAADRLIVNDCVFATSTR